MTNAPVKRLRRKALTDAGRALLNQQRQKLNREQAALGERLVEEARQAQSHQDLVTLRYKPEFNAVSRGILRRVAGVLASEGVTPAIEVNQGAFSAWTDFESIHVSYPGVDNDVRLTAATLRGMLYHEGGHIRWSVPYADMLAQAKNLMNQIDWDNLLLANTNFHGTKFHQAWNALEDQRMETAVVSDSPRKASYFVPVIIGHLTSNPMEAAANYPLLIWRRYLPRHIRVEARKAFVAFHEMLGDIDGEALAQAFEQTVTDYVTADNAVTMLLAVIDMEKLLQQHNLAFNLDDARHTGIEQPPRHRKAGDKREVKSIPISPDMLDDDAKEEGEDGEGGDAKTIESDSPLDGEQGKAKAAPTGAKTDQQGTAKVPGKGKGKDASKPGDAEGKGDDDADAEGSDAEGDSDDEAASQKAPPAPNAGSQAGVHDTAKDFQQMLDDAKAEAEAARDSDRALDGDEDAFRQALDNGHSKLPVYVGGISKDTAKAGQAEAVSQQIEDAFMALTADRQPGWIDQQRRGILDVNRWETRQPGNVEVFRQFADDDQPGYNMAVSILLDYSGSMEYHMPELAQAAYASKLACQRLGIPCTVTLWDSNGATLWDGNESPAGLPIINSAGGTDPDIALADLDNQDFGKEHHLVMVMTDGAWNGNWTKKTIGSYGREGRKFIGFGYGVSAYTLNRLGFNEAHQIKDLMVIPKVLERVLPAMA